MRPIDVAYFIVSVARLSIHVISIYNPIIYPPLPVQPNIESSRKRRNHFILAGWLSSVMLHLMPNVKKTCKQINIVPRQRAPVVSQTFPRNVNPIMVECKTDVRISNGKKCTHKILPCGKFMSWCPFSDIGQIQYTTSLIFTLLCECEGKNHVASVVPLLRFFLFIIHRLHSKKNICSRFIQPNDGCSTKMKTQFSRKQIRDIWKIREKFGIFCWRILFTRNTFTESCGLTLRHGSTNGPTTTSSWSSGSFLALILRWILRKVVFRLNENNCNH